MVIVLTVLSLGFLLLIAVIDTRTGRIPDVLSIPFLLLALLRGYLLGSSLLLPVLIGGGFFFLQWLISRGKWVGSGDIILAAGIGAFLGSVSQLIIALGIAYILGAVVATVLLLCGTKKIKERVPFGPFLVIGAFGSFFTGERVVEYF